MIEDDLAAVFQADMDHHPRTMQVELGPSEIGDPCSRKLAYRLALGKLETVSKGFPVWMGVQAHEGARRAFEADNERLGRQRWITERRVDIGRAAGTLISGTLDLYDSDLFTIIDFKFVGPTSLRNYRANGLSTVYRVQVHSYGQGMVNSGSPVERVGVLMLPRDQHLRQAKLFLEDFDPAIPRRALRRLEGIILAVRAFGLDAVLSQPTAESYCHTCPFFKDGSTDLREGCPGHDGRTVRRNTPALTFESAEMSSGQ